MTDSLKPDRDHPLMREAILVMLADCRDPHFCARIQRWMRRRPASLAKYLAKEADRLENDVGLYERIGPLARGARRTIADFRSIDPTLTDLVSVVELVGTSVAGVLETIDLSEGIAIDPFTAES